MMWIRPWTTKRAPASLERSRERGAATGLEAPTVSDSTPRRYARRLPPPRGKGPEPVDLHAKALGLHSVHGHAPTMPSVGQSSHSNATIRAALITWIGMNQGWKKTI